jgi:Amt family ammonium transporter
MAPATRNGGRTSLRFFAGNSSFVFVPRVTSLAPALLKSQVRGNQDMNQADTAWMLVATALVLLMTPALAFFYGGLVRSKNALNTMMMSFVSLGVVGIVWAAIGYSLAFAPGNNWIGDTSRVLLRGVGLEPQGTIPHLLFMCYQGTFAIITAALISGAIVERMRFSAYVVFITLWAIVIYSPIAHWVWGGGWLADLGALDFAGGTVVHVNAGVAALVAALCVGRRRDFQSSALLPHNVPFTLLGAGLLWFGWFGFNAGSALAASPSAALAFTTTMLAPAGTLVAWAALDTFRQQRVTAVGGATAIVVGLVAVTPAAGFIGPMSAIALGAIAAVPSYFGLLWRAKTNLDDSLDVVAAHGLGGTVGALLTGVFAQKALNGVADGLLFGNPRQLAIQAAAVGAAIVYSGVGSFVLLKLIALVVPLRASDADEVTGLDVTQHGEEAYIHGSGVNSGSHGTKPYEAPGDYAEPLPVAQ